MHGRFLEPLSIYVITPRLRVSVIKLCDTCKQCGILLVGRCEHHRRCCWQQNISHIIKINAKGISLTKYKAQQLIEVHSCGYLEKLNKFYHCRRSTSDKLLRNACKMKTGFSNWIFTENQHGSRLAKYLVMRANIRSVKYIGPTPEKYFPGLLIMRPICYYSTLQFHFQWNLEVHWRCIPQMNTEGNPVQR